MPPPTLLSGDRRSPLRNLRWLPLLLIPIALLTATYQVPTDSVGVLLRFGRFQSIQDPGLHFKVPFGIDEVAVVPKLRQLKLEFGFRTPDATNPWQYGRDARDDERTKTIVTGDLNAALVEWIVQYRIDDPRLYLFEVHAPEATLRDISEAVVREVIGDRTVDEVITVGRQDIENTALVRLREMSKTYQLGFAIDQVQLKNVNPPREVQASFDEVNKAEQDRESMINVANGEYNKVVPRAEGEAAQRISEAEGYQLKRVNEAVGDATAFNQVLAEYVKAPEVTKTRLYLETMREVLPTLGDKWIVDERVTQLLPLLPGAATGGSR